MLSVNVPCSLGLDLSFGTNGRGIVSKGLLVADLMVPRDGVEPPTPAFSGPGLSEAICLILLVLSVFLAIRITRFLEQ